MPLWWFWNSASPEKLRQSCTKDYRRLLTRITYWGPPHNGFQRMMITGKKQTDLALIYTDTILKMAFLIKVCKESQDTWEASAIWRLVYDRPFPITNVENKILKIRGWTTVSQLFDKDEPRFLDKQATLALPRNLQIKIDNIVANIKRKLMEFRNAPLQQNPAESILWDKQINLSHLLKKAEKKRQADLWTMALSRQTRTRDISQSRMSRPITRPMLRTISQASH